MNRCNENFIKNRNIDLSKLDCKIYDIDDINEIVSKYEVQGNSEYKNVMVEQILGMLRRDSNIPGYFPYVLDSYFDACGDGYHSRAVGMLEYDEENVIEKLGRSFQSEPMVLLEGDDDKYLVMTNGMHRFLVMRLLYLSSKSKCKSEEELIKLKQRFTIPVESKRIDFIKTYCKYLIDLFQPFSCMNQYFTSIDVMLDDNGNKFYKLKRLLGWNNYSVHYLSSSEMELLLQSYTGLESEYDSKIRRTGRSILTGFNNEKKVLTDEELIMFTKKMIINSNKDKRKITEILREQCQKYESFNRFLQTYFVDVIDINEVEEAENVNHKAMR